MENNVGSAEEQSDWIQDVSTTAKNCKNYIRNIVDNLHLQPNPEKPVIAFSIGDPTVYGNLKPSPETIEAMQEVLHSNNYNGYAPSVGYESSRAAVAEYLSFDDKSHFTAKDIVLCSGCSSALEISITALADANKNHNILAPRPGFSIYRTLAEAIGVQVKFYDLIPERDWQIDLDHLESLMDSNTCALILNNPSNPCGSVYDEDHLRDFLEIARKHRCPVIADEIYERLVFPATSFVSVASLSSQVPILICGGLAKRFLVPGWRLGWIAVHDEIGAFDQVRRALMALSQRIIGSNTLIQAALPRILRTRQSFHEDLIRVLNENAAIAYRGLVGAKGLHPHMPQGTMYMMIRMELDKFPFVDGLAFVTKLMEEESVFCLPGEAPEYMRIVLTVPDTLITEGCQRITEFCDRYYSKST